jgi:hypothetical protein
LGRAGARERVIDGIAVPACQGRMMIQRQIILL